MPHVYFFKDTPFEITNVVFTEWAIAAVLILVAVSVNRAVVSGKWTKLRGAVELLFDFLEGWYSSFIGGRKYARRFLPLLATLFMFILISNYSGMIPTFGYPYSGFGPTARWGTTLGLGLVVAVAVQVIAVKELGLWGWFKHIHHLGPLSVLEEFIHPFSLSLRLFGNIFGEETLLAVIIYLAPMVAPIPIMALNLLFGAIQAVVFTTLSAIYIGAVLEHAEHVRHKMEENGIQSSKPAPAH